MGEADGRAFLELQVSPPTAEVFVDDEYSGVVNRWAGQTMPIRPGSRRVELRAEGYLSQRFDVEVVEGQMHTLRVRMEPEFHLDGGYEEEGELW